MRRHGNTCKGFTLIELAITTFVAAVVLGGVAVFWLQGRQVYDFSDNVITLRQQGMTVLNEMTERFRTAQTASIVVSDNTVPNPPFASPPAAPAPVASGPGATIDLFDMARQENVRYSFNPTAPAPPPVPPNPLGASAPPNFGTIEETVWDVNGSQLYSRVLAGFVESVTFTLNDGVISISIVFHKDHIGVITVPHQQTSREDHRFSLQTAVGTRD